MSLDFITQHWDAVGALGQWAAAAGSVFAAVVALKLGYRASKPDINVSFSTVMPVIDFGRDLGLLELCVTAVNKGLRPVRLVTTGILLPDERTVGLSTIV